LRSRPVESLSKVGCKTASGGAASHEPREGNVFGACTSRALGIQLVLERLWLAAGPTAVRAFCKLRKVPALFSTWKERPHEGEAPGGPTVASQGHAYAGTLCLRTPIQNFARPYRRRVQLPLFDSRRLSPCNCRRSRRPPATSNFQPPISAVILETRLSAGLAGG